MTKRLLYRYLGTNGVLDTPIRIPDAHCIRMYDLIADSRHKLVNVDDDRVVDRIVVSEDEVNSWKEVPLDAVV